MHTRLLDELLQKLDGEVKVVMEATGIYNLPILTFLVEKTGFDSGLFAMPKMHQRKNLPTNS